AWRREGLRSAAAAPRSHSRKEASPMGSEPHSLRADAQQILTASLQAVQPDAAVRRALQDLSPSGGRILLVAAGKAAWQMARAALDCLGRVDEGIVITKYGHVRGELPGVTC